MTPPGADRNASRLLVLEDRGPINLEVLPVLRRNQVKRVVVLVLAPRLQVPMERRLP